MYNDISRQNREDSSIDIRKDSRFKDLGLSEGEARYIISYCKKFTNIRDTLEDILQEALVGLHLAFSSTPVVKHRIPFIRSVVRNVINARIVRMNRRDAIYHSVNTSGGAYSIENYSLDCTVVKMKRNSNYITLVELDYYGVSPDLEEEIE
jgi:DNA-directed RNA polymerase specialized sigma24 family protein